MEKCKNYHELLSIFKIQEALGRPYDRISQGSWRYKNQ